MTVFNVAIAVVTYFHIAVALGGLAVYLIAPSDHKVATLGLWTFGAGMLAFLLRVA